MENDKAGVKGSGNGIGILLKNPVVFLPFLILMILELIWLGMSYFAPRPPVSIVFAPIIRAFMGEQFLHYPLNFLTLPRLVFAGRILNYFGFGLIAYAMSVLIMSGIHKKAPVRILGVLNHSLRRYPALLMTAIVYGVCVYGAYKIPRLIYAWFFSSHITGSWAVASVVGIAFVCMVVVEALFVYTPMYIMALGNRVWPALKNSILFSFKNFLFSVMLILIARSMNLGMVIMKDRLREIIESHFMLFPEITLVILGLDILVMFFANLLIVVVAMQRFLTLEDIK